LSTVSGAPVRSGDLLMSGKRGRRYGGHRVLAFAAL